MKKRILIIDDDTYICNLLNNYLEQEGFETEMAFSGESAKQKIKSVNYDLVLCDYRLPDSDGLELLQIIKKKNIFTPVIIMTAYADIKMSVQLIKSGASDYVTKPIYPEEITNIIKKTLKPDNEINAKTFGQRFIAGNDPKMRKVMADIKVVAPTDMAILIEGETGSGKEFVARAIHFNSNRKNKPFIAVDCGALPKDTANSELFGHVKGSFTGALNDKKGYFEVANSGTLFLDEISNLSLENQVRLLRVLQEKKISRLGDENTIPVDVRIIAASNEDLTKAIDSQDFRMDLYHRINSFKIKLPVLRERKEDILIFISKFIERSNVEFNKNIVGIDADFKDKVLSYPWFGNIRELENVIKRCVLLSQGETLSVSSLPEEIKNSDDDFEMITADKDSSLQLKEATIHAEKKAILDALKKSNYNKTKAAKLLDIDRKTLYNKLKQFDIDNMVN